MAWHAPNIDMTLSQLRRGTTPAIASAAPSAPEPTSPTEPGRPSTRRQSVFPTDEVRQDRRQGRTRGLALVLLGAAALLIAACSAAPSAVTPTPSALITASPAHSPADSGPVDAVDRAYQAARGGGMTEQLDFIACVAGGSDAVEFGVLFGGLAELALATSGIDPDDYWDALRPTISDLSAVERSRSGASALVHVTVRVALDPDLARLREMMRAGLEARDEPIDDAAIDAIVSRLAGRLGIDRLVERDLTVTQAGGEWTACDSPR
jgi:hypothetical protein